MIIACFKSTPEADGIASNGKSGTDHHFVGRGGQLEIYSASLIGGDGFGNVQGPEFNFLIPGSARVVIGPGVECAIDDGVVGDFLTSTVTKYEDGGRCGGCASGTG